MKIFGLTISRAKRTQDPGEFVSRSEFAELVKQLSRIERQNYRDGKKATPIPPAVQAAVGDDNHKDDTPAQFFGGV